MRHAEQSSYEMEVKQRRVLLGLGRRASGRKSSGNRIGRGDEEEDRIGIQRRQLFDPLGRLNRVQDGASRVLNGLLNPTRFAAPEPTTSNPPAEAEPAPTTAFEEFVPPQPTTTQAPAPAPVQPTSVPPAPPVVAPTTQAPPSPPQTTQPPALQITVPITTSSVPSLTFIVRSTSRALPGC